MHMDRNEAMSALGAIDGAQAALARAADCPPWRHAVFGGVMGVIILSGGIAPPLSFALLGIAFAGIAAIVVSDRRRMGMFINGYRKGATRPLTFVMLGVMLVLAFGEFHAREAGLSMMTRVALAVIAAAVATAMSVMWQRIFRREMGLGA
jgi:hypothetical protein